VQLQQLSRFPNGQTSNANAMILLRMAVHLLGKVAALPFRTKSRDAATIEANPSTRSPNSFK
jgi:hypothetical protein